ncbi:AMP-dependent synthetase/ligase [Mastigocoleus testarum]|uniref:Long-chain fatty acid--CoA ligase n=1 Tax=Mastigocoleus testarum BC008 TaxID=371196 RepID=A0A0V7ZI71_9CYAN|nr:AMP-binding protein [Mastigocoleus testarum]KST63604.1 long-chain fatty acid--CoA ligase [Mastigocoleus testarum BC008]KST64178.1 long-chain fatty acid--CoA ligase [Mastigocoleus testarum BC008]
MNKYTFSQTEEYQMSGLIDYGELKSLSGIWEIVANKFGDITALVDPHGKSTTLTYSQLHYQIQEFATGIQALGIPQNLQENIPPRVALFADNSPRWMIADQGIMMAGAANTVRSATADREELLYILEHSGSIGLVVENLKTLHKLAPEIYNSSSKNSSNISLQWIVILFDEETNETANIKYTQEDSQTDITRTDLNQTDLNQTNITQTNIKIINFSQLIQLATGRKFQPTESDPQKLATLMYTSGTTGKPKGVMLSHSNLIHQLTILPAILQPSAGDKTLSILPTWHVFGRVGEYYMLSQGCTQIYTNRRYFKQDLQEYKPQYVIGVPRLWESMYEGIQKSFRDKPPRMQKLIHNFLKVSGRYIKAVRTWKKLDLENLNPSKAEIINAWKTTILLAPLHFLGENIVYRKIQQAMGGNIKQLICGGGSLAQHLENFFEIVGIEVLVGYGLTETSPVISARRYYRNLRGSSGKTIGGTQIKIVDLETKETLPANTRGLVMTKGEHVMQGYYLNPEATKKAIDSEGWFDTGDIGWLTTENQIILTGRAKDTIVLTNGENIEPQPIEDACLRSPYIDQIMLVGQDKKSLGALIVPNFEALEAWLSNQNSFVLNSDISTNLNHEVIRNLFREELNREVRDRPGYRRDDEIIVFELIPELFTIENGLLTQTLKLRRNVVMERYRDTITNLFS